MTWFNKLTGFDETTPEEVRNNLILDGETITSRTNGKSYHCGQLEIVSLGELRQANSGLLSNKGRIRIQEVVGDVQALHKNPSNKNALFQAASQFNLLEMTSPTVTPERGIGIYQFDRTQGPACAIACGAGTIYRNYFVPLNDGIGQTASNQVDCLDDVADYFNNEELHLWRMRNGYMLASEEGLLHINRLLGRLSSTEREELKAQLKIGVQWNTEVTLNGEGQLVSQAYCSALPVAYTSIDPIYWEGFACLILEALYEATFHAAVLNARNTGSNKVFLTLVGGGAFGNELSWIIDSISTALEKFRSTALDVRIVSYGHSNSRVRTLADRWQTD